jgi:hypothetical protein
MTATQTHASQFCVSISDYYTTRYIGTESKVHLNEMHARQCMHGADQLRLQSRSVYLDETQFLSHTESLILIWSDAVVQHGAKQNKIISCM